MTTATWFRVTLCTVVLWLEAEGGLTGLPSWLEEDRCYEFDTSLCSSYGYNRTALPNWLGHRTQSEAVLQLRTVMSLIDTDCSNELPFLLCVLYLPVCLHDPNSGGRLDVKPCRQLCQRVHDRCASKIKRKKGNWPTNFSCNDLPDADNADTICIGHVPNLPNVEGIRSMNRYCRATKVWLGISMVLQKVLLPNHLQNPRVSPLILLIMTTVLLFLTLVCTCHSLLHLYLRCFRSADCCYSSVLCCYRASHPVYLLHDKESKR